MSRMLRGQATLQGLIGKNSITKRHGNVQRGLKRSSGDGAGSEPERAPPAQADAQPAPELAPLPAKRHRAQQRTEQVPDGCVACPVCGRALDADEGAVNAHLDKCLAKADSARGKSQTTLARFAVSRQPGSAGSKQRRQERRQDAAPSASPPAAGSDASGGAAEAAWPSAATAPPRLQSPFKRRSQQPAVEEREAGGTPPPKARPMSEAALYPSPAQLASQPPALPASAGAGGQAGAGAPEGAVGFATLAVGRRFSSSGVAEVGQTAVLQQEPGNARDADACLLVAQPPGGVLGYLPRRVAAFLGPLLQAGLLGSTATVSSLGGNAQAPIPVLLQVWPTAAADSPEAGEVGARLAQAAAAAEGALKLQRSSSGTGEILRANFLLLLETVLRADGRLFSAEELRVFEQYKALSPPAQALFLRLFLRAGPWFKLASLAYSEVPDARAAAGELGAAGLAQRLAQAPPGCRAAVGRCLTVVELSSLLAGRGLLPKGRKAATKDGLQALLGQALDAPAGGDALAAAEQLAGPLLRLAPGACEAVGRAQRLFFLNEGQSLSSFLPLDLGILLYPEYAVQCSRPAFQDREQLLAYESALGQAAALDAALERDGGPDAAAAEAALAPALAAIQAGEHRLAGFGAEPETQGTHFLHRFCAAWVHTCMATLRVSMLEKAKRHADACELLRQLLGGRCCPGRRGEWWCRLTINLRHLRREEEALETAEAALADEWVRHGDRLELQRRLLRLATPPRRWRVPGWAAAARREPREVRVEAQPLPNALGLKSRFPDPTGRGGAEVTVEQLALWHYSREAHGGWRGVHAEGGIWATLFGLLMWEVLFAPVPDVFRNPFQTAPLDLPTPAFTPARQAVIAATLERIREGNAAQMLRERWQASHRTMCAGVNWERNSLEELAEIAGCLGGRGLAEVCRLLADDRSGWQGGMPDLLLWHPARRAARLAEVKGPRDSLSMQQRAWLNALAAAGLDCEVLKVVEPGAKKRRR